MYTRVGFGQKPQVEVPGAASGRVRPYKNWRPVEQATMSYGYGISVSMMQLARAYTAFARDGEMAQLTFLQSDAPAPAVRVFSPQVARDMRHMLQMAAGKGGTAPKSQAVGYSVGGKTGTARKLVGRAYSESKYRSFFVGLAPVSNPRLVVAVMIDEPGNGVYYGGEVAAPAFADIVQNALRTLGVPPDLAVQPDLTVVAVEESY
jgi:cell division protein FtsI (penicillin-binding protein 3)